VTLQEDTLVPVVSVVHNAAATNKVMVDVKYELLSFMSWDLQRYCRAGKLCFEVT